jgi:hypothetical protein
MDMFEQDPVMLDGGLQVKHDCEKEEGGEIIEHKIPHQPCSKPDSKERTLPPKKNISLSTQDVSYGYDSDGVCPNVCISKKETYNSQGRVGRGKKST